MKKIRCISMATVICIIAGTMTGCSYKEFEDKTLSGIKKFFNSEKSNDSNNYAKNDDVDSGKSSEKLEESTKNIIKDNAIREMGSLITIDLPYEGEKHIIEYTINNTKVYSSLDESNIDKNLILNRNNENIDKILGNGKKLILANVTVKNVDRNSNINIGELGLNYIMENGEKSSGNFMSEIEYFSLATLKGDGKEKGYYNYNLEKGESKIAEIGWIIDPNEVDLDRLYICIGSHTSYEYQKFVKLDIGEGKK
ncbi:protein of unknown function [Clostridium collagenovorans DSM 3089]|uniref:Lipoprotein n=1 Tax=Clostridium collagenovorans DSM 3089 TaxID=1121306 RepID=A0A1M5V783_9CLOT|nr:DUF5027 family lipoprotein [Clostridium collagenovorans]SHH70944.1 protein of unknown function [Clostridium collagenovorans DSM 3089]